MISRIESKAERVLYPGAALLCMGILALSVWSYWGAKFVMDDALMFVRYADNFLATGTIAWNIEDGPAYGTTSLAFLAVIIAISSLVSSTPYVINQIGSCLIGVLFLWLTAGMIRREVGEDVRSFAYLIVAAGLAGGATFLSAQFMTGMDTTLAMCVYGGLLMLWRRREMDARLVGVLSGAAMLVRPDLLLVTGGVPLCMFITGGADERGYWKQVLLSAVLSVAVLFAGLTAYFGTPVPLAAFAKIFSPYGSEFKAVYRSMPIKQSLNLVAAYWLLFSVTAGLLILNFRALCAREHRLILVVLAAMVGWFIYLLGVTQIMAYRGRFYHPVVLPSLILLFVWGMTQSVVRWKGSLAGAPEGLRAAVMLVVLASVFPRGLSVAEEFRSHIRKGYVGQVEVPETYDLFWADFWYRLPDVTSVAPDLVIATTEVGLPGILLPAGSIIDLAGLNDRQIAMNGFDVHRLLNDRKPDVIYMPHPHYVDLNRALSESEAFNKSYSLYSGDLLGVDMGVALRKVGPHYTALERLMPEVATRPNETHVQ